MSDQLSDHRKKKLTKAEEAKQLQMMLFSAPQTAQIERLIVVGVHAAVSKAYADEITPDIEAAAAHLSAEHKKIFELQEAAFPACLEQLHYRLVEGERREYNRQRPTVAFRDSDGRIVRFFAPEFVPPERPLVRSALEALLVEQPESEVAVGREPGDLSFFERKYHVPVRVVPTMDQPSGIQDHAFDTEAEALAFLATCRAEMAEIETADRARMAVSQPLPESGDAANAEVTDP